jgi:tetratricopeptide (TPR) repeat protein
LAGLTQQALGGEKSLTIIDVRAAWEKFPQADFGSNAAKLQSLPVAAIQKLTAMHTAQMKASRLAWLSNFAKTNLARDGGFKGHVEVGMAYAQSLFYAEAIDWMRKALLLNPNSSFIFNNLANVYYLSGDITQALSHYHTALTMSRNDPRTLLNLAFIHYETGKGETARQYYLKAILIDPSLDRPEYQVLASEDKAVPKSTTSPH